MMFLLILSPLNLALIRNEDSNCKKNKQKERGCQYLIQNNDATYFKWEDSTLRI